MFTEFNPIVALWLFPVALNILLPLTMLLVYFVIKVVQAFYTLFAKAPDATTTGTHQAAPAV